MLIKLRLLVHEGLHTKFRLKMARCFKKKAVSAIFDIVDQRKHDDGRLRMVILLAHVVSLSES